jgi:hypothetical protein
MRRTTTGIRSFAAVVAIGALVSLAPAAHAAKGGGGSKGGGKPSGGSSSFSLVLLDSTDGVPHWSQRVTFDISTTQTDKPYVDLRCSQNGTLVYTNTAGYYDGYAWSWNQTMDLESQAWTGGDADCAARLYSASNSGATTTLATMTFHVYA